MKTKGTETQRIQIKWAVGVQAINGRRTTILSSTVWSEEGQEGALKQALALMELWIRRADMFGLTVESRINAGTIFRVHPSWCKGASYTQSTVLSMCKEVFG